MTAMLCLVNASGTFFCRTREHFTPSLSLLGLETFDVVIDRVLGQSVCRDVFGTRDSLQAALPRTWIRK